MNNINIMVGDNSVKGHKDIQLVVFPSGDISTIKSRNVDKYLSKGLEYAREHKVYTVPSLYVKDNYLCLCIINENGDMVYEQKATHLNKAWFSELRRGDDIEVIETPFGNIFLCVDVDIYKPEVLRIASLKGADIAISCQYIREDHYSTQMILSGAWQQAQQNCIYVISATNNKSSIIGPCKVVSDSSGFIQKPTCNYPIIGQLSMDKREYAHNEFPIFNGLNHKLYNNHIVELCE